MHAWSNKKWAIFLVGIVAVAVGIALIPMPMSVTIGIVTAVTLLAVLMTAWRGFRSYKENHCLPHKFIQEIVYEIVSLILWIIFMLE
ncbi:MAG TPA: hypothetical protein H9668_09545 [Firmicutes bacterium]|nr:hypothetical protein [Bacillota bacterium]